MSNVLDNILDTINVMSTANIITKVNNNTFIVVLRILLLVILKNIVNTKIRVGNLPLQGINELVSIAINLSLLESIILAPVTPTSLHPIHIHIVRACLPQVPFFSK